MGGIIDLHSKPRFGEQSFVMCDCTDEGTPTGGPGGFPYQGGGGNWLKDYVSAVTAAKSARFEHGEKGAPA